MKSSIYFDTVEEMNANFPNGVPSKYVVIIGKNQAVYTSSNNFIQEDVPEEQGGEILDPETEAHIRAMEIEIEAATNKTIEIEEGPQTSTIEVHE